ncbi:GAP family protein [Aeromicrobium choanae]|uniref:Sap, sulfolipid-1-addressing protein n=1 Tax=Aeromicrobium choanae TaxID=1736691 RepID=A0A1T4Z256_9ACTN|nr:GAP family protein [Aeromicrobium choanae]SKB08122.1 Sap, sulfolipid-1-addressing protein [Aeromicrobium choanae]
MGLILSILMLGLMASLSPATIVVFILVLGTARPRANATGFLFGWAISLTVVFTASYLIGSSRSVRHGDGRTGLMVFEILVGCALVVVSAQQWRRRGVPRVSSAGAGSTRMLGRLRGLGPGGALVLGVLKQPWAITTAAAIFLVHHHAQALVTVIAFACFTVASTASVGLMYVFYARRPGEADAYLERLRARAVASGPAVFAVAALLVGTFLVLDGLLGLTGR